MGLPLPLGEVPHRGAERGKALSVTLFACQLSRRESQVAPLYRFL